MLNRIALTGFATLVAFQASAAQPTLTQRWQEFQKNPKQFMEMNPLKKDAKGNPIVVNSFFSKNDVQSKAFIDKKSKYRLGSGTVSSPICDANGVCLDDVVAGKAPARQSVKDWLDLREFQAKGVKPVGTLEEMEKQGLMSAKLDETPWSDTYWPISQGILGVRYANPVFGALGHNWKARFDLLSNPKSTLASIYQRADAKELDTLSPSEKYDLLIGDLKGGFGGKVYEAGYLTPSMWREGEGYFKSSGKVEDWMGICHGWAPAAFMEKRPKKSIVLKAADGKTDIKMYPSDIKGLASYLWAKVEVPTQFIGGRCNSKDPKKDPTTGRVLDEGCFDTNPANWHVGTINQIGLAKRSFVLDATFDYEVWNQPVYGYTYRYFNPQTGTQVKTIKDATTSTAAFTNDKFKKFRSKNAVAVIGIEMDLTYVVETEPTHSETDAPNRDQTQTVTYMYDLELNAAGQIVGGEWYSNKHPDFLWMPLADGSPVSYGDSKVGAGSWDVGQPLPKFWRDIAIQTAQKYGQPMTSIVQPMIEAARK
ncbi:MAG: hypothetical protein AAB250_06800 [Bdellovibrionota bacterium]